MKHLLLVAVFIFPMLSFATEKVVTSQNELTSNSSMEKRWSTALNFFSNSSNNGSTDSVRNWNIGYFFAENWGVNFGISNGNRGYRTVVSNFTNVSFNDYELGLTYRFQTSVDAIDNISMNLGGFQSSLSTPIEEVGFLRTEQASGLYFSTVAQIPLRPFSDWLTLNLSFKTKYGFDNPIVIEDRYFWTMGFGAGIAAVF